MRYKSTYHFDGMKFASKIDVMRYYHARKKFKESETVEERLKFMVEMEHAKPKEVEMLDEDLFVI